VQIAQQWTSNPGLDNAGNSLFRSYSLTAACLGTDNVLLTSGSINEYVTVGYPVNDIRITAPTGFTMIAYKFAIGSGIPSENTGISPSNELTIPMIAWGLTPVPRDQVKPEFSVGLVLLDAHHNYVDFQYLNALCTAISLNG
jgi:hypothetical protein